MPEEKDAEKDAKETGVTVKHPMQGVLT